MMRLRVDCHVGDDGEEVPRRVHLDGRSIEVEEILDRWLAPDHRYFKIMGSDRAIYMIRHNVPSDVWELTLYRAREVPPAPPEAPGRPH